MSLSDTAIRRAVAKNRPYKLYDAGGLFLLVMPSGGKWWRFKYRFNKKGKVAFARHLPRHLIKDGAGEARSGTQKAG